MIPLSSALSGHSWGTAPALPSPNQPRGTGEIRAVLAEVGALRSAVHAVMISTTAQCWRFVLRAPRTERWMNFCSVVLFFWYGIKKPFQSKPVLLYPSSAWRGRGGFHTGGPRCCALAGSTRSCLGPCSGANALEMFALHVAVPFYLQVWLYKCSCLKDTRQGINLWAHRPFEHRQPQHLAGNKESWSGSFLMKSWQHIRGAAWPRDVSKDLTLGV